MIIPEIFAKIDFFININCEFFGHKKNNKNSEFKYDSGKRFKCFNKFL